MGGTAVISAVGALSQLLIMLLLGLPYAVPVAILSFFACFIPYVGGFVTTGLAFLIAVAFGDVATIVIMGIYTVVFNIVQGNIVTPLVYRRAVHLHPAVILLAIPAGGALAGIIGMFLAVPILALFATIRLPVMRLLEGEPLPGQPTPDPPTDARRQPGAGGRVESSPMSGHSKWSQIKRQKGANDAKRGALFTKLTREIITAARQGGPDTEANYRLRMAVDKARANSMPADNIKRAIERATGAGGEAEQYEEITYEGLGPANVAVIVATMTDNKNRTAAEVRALFTRAGGSFAPVSWQFEHRGVLSVPLNGNDPDEVSLAAIDAGAVDVGSPEGGAILVVTDPTDLERVRTALTDAGFPPETAEVSMEPTTKVEIEDEKGARQVLDFVERLEDLDDVQTVYANFDIPDALMEQLEASVVGG